MTYLNKESHLSDDNRALHNTNKNHPNYVRWKRGRDLAEARGNLVMTLLEKSPDQSRLPASLPDRQAGQASRTGKSDRQVSGKVILDLGSGEGGTSKVFSMNNKVLSIDLSMYRLKRQDNYQINLLKINADALVLPIKEKFIDIIIIQDVVEHLHNHKTLLTELKRVLKKDGIIYLSTPNKKSVLNIISDPHWGLPFLSLFKRKTIKKIFLNNFRKKDSDRNDIAELFSLRELENLFADDFHIRLMTSSVTEIMLNGIEGVVWSNFHLKLLALIKFLKLDKLILNISNDKSGFVNDFFTPTFYFIMQRKTRAFF
jgi:2-polyprenyl-3-methyl-5-hydroxy-6-metoxy-1,4-benzoquinol methylase